MLSWDEFDQPEETPARAQAAKPVVQEPDLDSLEKLDNAGDIAAHNARTVNAGDSEALARATAALDTLEIEEGLQELEGAAVRVRVDEKRMINCRADLNQLVPFK